MTITCLPINASAGSPAYSAQNLRQAFSVLLANGTPRTLGSQSGTVPGREPALSATTTTWSFGAGAFVVDAAFTTTQAPYLVSNDAAVTGAMNAPHATLPRIDSLCLQVSDTDIDSSGARAASVVYTAGVAASSPSPPAQPARSALISTISVPPSGGGSPSAVLNQVFAVAAGGILPVFSNTNRDAVITNPYDGYPVYRRDTNSIEIYNGTSWDVFPVNAVQSINNASDVPGTAAGNKMQSDTFTATFTASAASAGSVTFPVAFTTVPVVVPAVQVGSNLDIIVNTVSVTNAAFSWRAFTNTGGTVSASATIHWIAIGT